LCQSLKKITVGAASDVSSSPASTSSDCGLDFDAAALGSLASQEPSAPEHCEALYLTTNKAGATLDDICPNGCNVSVELVDGTQVVKNLEGGSGGSSPTPNPSPDKNTSPGGSNQGGGPPPYGPTPLEQTTGEVTDIEYEASDGIISVCEEVAAFAEESSDTADPVDIVEGMLCCSNLA